PVVRRGSRACGSGSMHQGPPAHTLARRPFRDRRSPAGASPGLARNPSTGRNALNRSRWLLLVVVAVVVVGALWMWRSRAGGGSAPRYRTVAVERGSIQSTVSATGTVNPVVQVEVGSQVSGTVQKIFADYNQRV